MRRSGGGVRMTCVNPEMNRPHVRVLVGRGARTAVSVDA
ncbi:hypothetical protein T261_4778 [Streptomyces lydicus]|nr:hypothetical protein T261_4778 [Streptomyces lydicus]